MDIASLPFALIALTSVLIFYLIEPKFRIGYLTFLSSVLIASFNYLLLFYIIIYSLINYYVGIKISVSENKKAWFRSGIVLNIFQLIMLKYSSFAIDPIFNLFGLNLHISKLTHIIIPIGISYFTLQGIGYLINVKMGWEKPEKKFMDFLLYITFFPKFLSGPIERSNHFLPQLKVTKQFNEEQVTEGLRITLLGFFKKIAIANQLAPFVNNIYSNIQTTDSYSLWILFIITPLYLYFDFSGYTDIAIGIAKSLGIELLPNFNRPFFAENVTTFWKRFHISLSSWFNDYVFRQISFRRRQWGIYASVYAVFVTWILFGIWHGAGWNFMLLGLLQASAIIFEFFTKKIRLILFSKAPNFVRIWIGRAATYLFYCCSLVLFFSPSINEVFIYISKLIHIKGLLMLGPLSRAPYLVIIILLIFLLLELIKNDFKGTSTGIEKFWKSDRKSITVLRWSVYSLILTIIVATGDKVEQFIYVNF